MRPEVPMQTIALSENAVAVLRFRVKGWRFPVRERDRDAFGELVEAGIMTPDGEDFRFSDGGWARREELLAAAEAHLRSLDPRLPDRLDLSRAARRTLARHLAGDHEVTDANRVDYRELARAGIMESVGTFTKGDDCVFQLTRQGWERREEFQRPVRRLSASAISKSLSRAFSWILRGVSAAR
jgi:hypothetical protein